MAWLAAIASLGMHAGVPLDEPLHAQKAPPSSASTALPGSSATRDAANESSLEGWLLAGVDATFHPRLRVMATGGYVGGFDSWIVLAEGTFTMNGVLQAVAGHVVLRPDARDAMTTSVLRGGVNWSPLRSRVSLDNRLFVERRSTSNRVTARVRDRLRLSWAIANPSSVRLFAAVEAFAIDRRGLSERRYQAGLMLPVKHISLETYWLRSVARTRSRFDTLVVTMLWRIAAH